MRLISILASAFCVSVMASAASAAPQSAGEVRGRAVDASDAHGLSGVAVSLVGASRVTASGADGTFTLGGVPAGPQTIACSAAGYRPAQVALTVVAGGVHQIRCSLTRLPVLPGAPLAAKAGKRSAGAADSEFVLGVLGAGAGASPSVVDGLRGDASIGVGNIGTVGHGRGGGGYGSVSGVGAGAAAPMEARSSRGFALRASPAPAMVIAAPPTQGGPASPADTESREGYDGIVENAFLGAQQTPLSTFSIDVDSASYANVRRFLKSGSRPPRDAVRVEELINYFRYEYPNPTDGKPFSVNTEVSEAPWKPEHRLVRIGLQGPRIAAERLPPANLTFLIDVSGSMNGPKRLPLLKQSFRLLIDELRPQDRVSMVVYAGAAGVVLPPTEGSEKGRIIEALEGLQAGGSTAGAEGIRLAYQTARASFVQGGNNRVILATDGDFNVGTSSDAELVQLIEQERKSGVFLTILGFGMGNYQDAKMQKLADAGNGHHAYIDDLDEARKTLVAEMGATLLTVAKDMKVQVEFNPARVKAYRLIGYENRRLADADFNNDQKDAGELGAGHSVTVLYELIPAGSDEAVPGIDPLKYQAVSPTAAAGGDELLTVKLRYKAPDADASRLHAQALVDTHTPLAQTSDDFRFAAAVAEFGMLLRESPHRGTASFGGVLTRAQAALGRNTGGLRTGFLEVVRAAAGLYGQALAR